MTTFMRAVKSRDAELTLKIRESWMPNISTFDIQDYLWLHSLMPEYFMERAYELNMYTFLHDILIPFIQEERYFHVTDNVYNRVLSQSSIYYKTFGINIVNTYERYEKYFNNVHIYMRLRSTSATKYYEEFIAILMFSSHVLEKGDVYFKRMISTNPLSLLELMLVLEANTESNLEAKIGANLEANLESKTGAKMGAKIGIKRIMKCIPIAKEIRIYIKNCESPFIQKRLAKLRMNINYDSVIWFDINKYLIKKLLIHLPYGMYCNKDCFIRISSNVFSEQITELLRSFVDYKIIRSHSNKHPEKYHYLFNGLSNGLSNGLYNGLSNGLSTVELNHKVKVFTWKLNFRRMFNLRKNVERNVKYLRETNII